MLKDEDIFEDNIEDLFSDGEEDLFNDFNPPQTQKAQEEKNE